MTTWLSRSLTLIAIGAILAWAIDAHPPYVDLSRAGLVLIAVGGFDLLLNLGLLTYDDLRRRPADRVGGQPRPARPHIVDYARDPYPPTESRTDAPTQRIRRLPGER